MPNPAAVLPTGGGAPAEAGDDLDAIDRKLAEMRAGPHYAMDTKKYNELYEKRKQLATKSG